MRKALVATLVVTAVTCSCAVEIENAQFAAGRRGELPPGWVADGPAAEVFAMDDADGVGDARCLRYRSEQELDETLVRQEIALQPETDYVLSAWLKSDGTTRPAVVIRQPGERDFVVSITSDGATSWRRFQMRFNSGPLTQAPLQVYGDLGPGRASRAGQAWIDAVRVLPAAEAEAYEGPIAGGYGGPDPGENVALGKSYTFSEPPRYSLTFDDGDATQLTDGRHTVGYFWAQKTSVGWSLRRPLTITIDLEESVPITGLSYNTAAGAAGVGWPAMIFILTSEDGKSFQYHGELIALSAEHGLPAPQRYTIHRYYTDRLRAAGRYLRLVICPGSQYCFCDEIEVYRGDFPMAQARAGEPIESTEQLVEDRRLYGIVGVRCMYDIQDLRQRIARAGVPDGLKADLNARLDRLADEVRSMRVGDIDFWRGLPYNELHARIYAVNAPLRRAQGSRRLSIWQSNRWDMLEPMGTPSGGSGRVEVLAMRGEYRSAAFNISNFGDQPALARVGISLEGIDTDVVTVHEVQYVQTQERAVVANALPVADTDREGRARIPVPAGMTKQVWLTVHPVDVPPGRYQGEIVIDIATETLRVPLRVEVAPLEMPRPPVSLFCWDYVGDRVSYAPEFQRPKLMAENLEAHFADVPWANPGVVPWPADGSFDAEGHITQPMDFGALDRWIDRFPNARTYCMFAHFGGSGSFRGLARGTDRWHVALGEWARAITDHLAERGVGPERWAMLILDEPHSEEAEQVIADVARAMKAAVPQVQVFEDPVRPDPTQAVQEMYQVCDILCPNTARLYRGGEKAIDFYQALQEQGKRFWIYLCSGPHKLLDPITYHRLHFWHAWRLGATGVGFWGYVDHQGTGSSWDNFKGGGTSYSLVYADDRHLADSKQWEACREGVEDYTTLWMLRRAVAEHEGEGTPAVREARELLQRLPEQMPQFEPGAMRWATERDRSGP
ncbi:MAG: hypothetical protein U9R79_05975, partial [Armatimonadota bacterium]|nr:hypothetical protein [Armatimonadota bacterium]